MLELKNITKDYKTGNEVVHALKDVSLAFRKSEFVSILGPSGCGKTTMLNIIGGLDNYTGGDLKINGKSTKKFTDRDWDTYRNHSVGFVFQSYNLIPHQTVLSNVELALTLSGVSKSERRKRAVKALEDVGLGNQLKKKPLQMSGGQMQRVAIARALVNDPDIILADEPTGALDTETSIQVMEILKKVSEKKLVIMVTHNPELANKYSSRIIRLLDGKIIDDSMPYKDEAEENESLLKYSKHSSMSRATSISLSFNNLKTKKARSFLTSFAGSIGIIGIALILSVSTGMQLFINAKEEEALSNYPIEIDRQASDMSSMFSSLSGKKSDDDSSENETQEKISQIQSNNFMSDMIDNMYSSVSTNDLTNFKEYIEHNQEKFDKVTNDVQYQYSTQINIYKDSKDEVYRVNPTSVFDELGMSYMTERSQNNTSMPSMSMSFNVWTQLPGNINTLSQQYELIDGKFPKSSDEVVIVTDENGKISDFTLYTLGVLDNEKLRDMANKMNKGEKLDNLENTKYSFKDLEKLKFRLLLNTDYYKKNTDGTWEDKSDDDIYISQKLKDAKVLKVVGIVKAGKNTGLSAVGGVGYTSDLMTSLIDEINNSEIVKAQRKDKKTDVFTGIKFKTDDEKKSEEFKSMDDLNKYIATLPDERKVEMQGYIKQMKDSGMSDDEILNTFNKSMEQNSTDATYDSNLELLGAADIDTPSSILLYPKDFDSKDAVADLIDQYNRGKDDDSKITYTDFIGIFMSSVTVILNAITTVLIGFVSISLVVSSIMIAIITYISVLERTKEIGILRAIGASKKNISQIFNAEALIIGFSSGALGIIITIILDALINVVAKNALDIKNIASLPVSGGIILIIISMLLSYIAGVIPARMAAKKDPVTALRSE